jgi:hypothetical protein
MRAVFGAALAAILLTAAPAAAKPIPTGGVTVNDVADVLTAEGYKAEIGKDGVGDPKITSGSGGKVFYVIFYGCKDGRCTAYQMHAGFEADPSPGLTKVNDWNTRHRFGRAFLDKDNDPIVEMDIDAERGFTSESISNNLATWVTVLASFVKEFDL